MRIGDGYLDTLIDTGASYTFMDMSMLEHIAKSDSQFSGIELQESEIGIIECSNGSHQDILGQFKTTLQIGSVCFDTLIQVAKTQPVPFILGGDALESIAALIDYRTRTLTPQVAEHLVGQLESPVPSQYQAFKLKNDITVAPQAGALIRMDNDEIGKCKFVLIEPNESSLAKNQLIATSIVHNGSDKTFLMQVVNLTAAAVTPPAGTKLGKIIPLLDFYHVKATAQNYSTVVKTVTKEAKL